MKSILRYPGGKTKVAKFLVDLFPSFDEYREPFVGGASVFIHTQQTYPQKKYWINDKNQNLYLFFYHAKHNPEQLIETISKFIKQHKHHFKKFFYSAQQNILTYTDIERAAIFFILNRTSFSGTTESGGFSQDSFNKLLQPRHILKILDFSQLAQHTKITNYDFQQVIERMSSHNVFLFLDPPYWKAKTSKLYGKQGDLHYKFDHERLCEVLQKTHYKWLITYDNSEYIRKLYKWAYITEWKLVYAMRNVGNTSMQESELLISNYDIKQNNLF